MRGKKPKITCTYEKEGEEVRDIIMKVFRQFLARELEREAGERVCP